METKGSAFHKYKNYSKVVDPFLTEPKKRIYISTIFSFLAISLFSWYGIRPTVQTILRLRREIADKIVINKQMEDKITSVIEAQATYEQSQDKLYVIDQALPENPDVIPLTFQLRGIADDVGASISAINIPAAPILSRDSSKSASVKPGTVQEIPMTLTVEGSYLSLKAFLESMFRVRRILSVSSILMNETKGTDKDPGAEKIIRMNIKMNGFYALPERKQ